MWSFIKRKGRENERETERGLQVHIPSSIYLGAGEERPAHEFCDSHSNLSAPKISSQNLLKTELWNPWINEPLSLIREAFIYIR